MTQPNLVSVFGALALAASAALAEGNEESVVYWVSAPVEPGETVMMCGFFPEPEAIEVAVGRLSDRNPGKPSGQPWQPPDRRRWHDTVKPLHASETAVYNLGVLSESGSWRSL